MGPSEEELLKEANNHKSELPPPVDLTKHIKKEPDPDIVFDGNISYKMEWFGNKCKFSVENMTYEHRALMMNTLFEDLSVLVENERSRKNFTTSDKTSIMKAKYLAERFLIKYLQRVWVNMNPELQLQELQQNLTQVVRYMKTLKEGTPQFDKVDMDCKSLRHQIEVVEAQIKDKYGKAETEPS